MIRRLVLCVIATGLVAPLAAAHVGSPDVFFEGDAGPYRLYVTVRPPAMIPGVAEVEIRSASSDVQRLALFPMRVVGPASRNPPAPDVVQPSRTDPQFFASSVWLMGSGSWQIRIQAEGTRGRGEMAVPVPAFARRTLRMQVLLGSVLFVLMLGLGVGVVVIAGAAAREARLAPGVAPDVSHLRRGRRAMIAAGVAVVSIIGLGNWWWGTEASTRAAQALYKAPSLAASLGADGRLTLRVGDSAWHTRRNMKTLIPDHGHLMHLFVVRTQGMDRFAHLHPEQEAPGLFTQALPPLPAGRYRLFADVVHETGFPDTLTAEIELPELTGTPLAGDDSQGRADPIGGSVAETFRLEDGGRVVWKRDAPLTAKRLHLFRFQVEDERGAPAPDLQLYMGMPGHAAFVKSDLTTFAHVHPAGSVSMPALALAEASLRGDDAAGVDPHASHAASAGLPPEITFPYGFPGPGAYRIFVQFKRAGRVQTAVFDARVEG